MTFENVTFNAEYWRDKKEHDFVKHESHHGLSVEQLKEAFKIIKGNTPQQEPEKKKDDADFKGAI